MLKMYALGVYLALPKMDQVDTNETHVVALGSFILYYQEWPRILWKNQHLLDSIFVAFETEFGTAFEVHRFEGYIV